MRTAEPMVMVDLEALDFAAWVNRGLASIHLAPLDSREVGLVAEGWRETCAVTRRQQLAASDGQSRDLALVGSPSVVGEAVGRAIIAITFSRMQRGAMTVEEAEAGLAKHLSSLS